MRVAAIGDLHCRASSHGRIGQLLEGVQSEAEVLVMAGDLTNLGLSEEMEALLAELDRFDMPKVAVTGNHDHENDQSELLVHMMVSAGIHVLEGDVWEFDGVEFVGVKGFCGGFGRHRLQPFGERLLKTFIHHSIAEVVRLESALERCRSERRVAVLHYAPIAATLKGEHPEIYPFLGFSLLADALDRHGVDVVVHGHAHHGSLKGATPGGIPVHNVSRHVRTRRHRSAYLLIDV
jgi:Icc-related predicted phosphoesterase